MPRRVLSSLACAGLGTLAACNALTETSFSGTPVAVVVLDTRAKGAGFTTSPTVNFYKAQNITFSSTTAATDSCQQLSYSTTAAPSGGSAELIGGGAFVLVQLSGRSDSLRKASTADQTYRLAAAAGLTFTPGDSVFLTIPGDAAGFPSASVAGKTAEPFTLAPIVVPPATQNMTVTWSAASDANAAMLISFRFHDGAGTGVNQQLFCDFRDDGTGTVQAALIAKWAASGEREVLAERLRTAVVRVPSSIDAFINLISTFDLPTPVSP